MYRTKRNCNSNNYIHNVITKENITNVCTKELIILVKPSQSENNTLDHRSFMAVRRNSFMYIKIHKMPRIRNIQNTYQKLFLYFFFKKGGDINKILLCHGVEFSCELTVKLKSPFKGLRNFTRKLKCESNRSRIRLL